MFLLFALFKSTLDERKTLTKISMHKTSHIHSKQKEKKAVCIIGGDSEALGFHQEATEESRKQQDCFCIKLYIISYQITFILAVWY